MRRWSKTRRKTQGAEREQQQDRDVRACVREGRVLSETAGQRVRSFQKPREMTTDPKHDVPF